MSAIDDKASQLPWIGGPVDEGGGSGEGAEPDGRGRSRDFQNGSIFWTAETGAHEVHGDIRVKWARLGGTRSFLGYPVTDETGTPDGRGRFNHFEHGSIYWTPEHGAFEIHGAIRELWSKMGWERSSLGYPLSDETGPGDHRANRFERGVIEWTPQGGAHARAAVAFD